MSAARDEIAGGEAAPGRINRESLEAGCGSKLSNLLGRKGVGIAAQLGDREQGAGAQDACQLQDARRRLWYLAKGG